MRIYITRSRFSHGIEESKLYKKAFDLIDVINKIGHETVYKGEWHGYPEIYKAISSCNCLLAFTNKDTISSTWRAIEMTYASKGVGAFEIVDFHIPVFLYTGIDNDDCMFLSGFVKWPDVYKLPIGIHSAARKIESIMENI